MICGRWILKHKTILGDLPEATEYGRFCSWWMKRCPLLCSTNIAFAITITVFDILT